MTFTENCQHKFLTSGILLTFVWLVINLQSGLVEAATLHKTRSANVRVKESCKSYCKSSICEYQVKFFSRIMNESVHPCDDFYQFVCGNFNKNWYIPDASNVADMFNIMQDNVANLILYEVQEEIKPNELDVFKKFKIFYKNCMNESRIEEIGVEPMLQWLKNIGGWPVLLGHNWNENDLGWGEVVYKINQEKFPVFFPVTLSVDVDEENSSKTILTINSAVTTIDQVYLANYNYLTAYYRLIVKSAVALGANEEAIGAEIESTINFEIDLFKIKMSGEQTAGGKATTNRMTIKELSEKHPSIPWLEFINTILKPSGVSVDEAEIINVKDPEFIFQLEKLLKITPKRVLVNYLAWQTIFSMLMFGPSNFQQIWSDFLSEVDALPNKQLKKFKCLDDTMEVFPLALSSIFVRKYFNREIKKQSYELIQNIKNQIKMNFEEIDWMDEETRKAALEKLEALGVFVGYTDELMNDEKVNVYYNDLEMKPNDYMNSILNFRVFDANKKFATLKRAVDRNSWTLRASSIIVNAFYKFRLNTIEIPAAILGDYFYQIDRPQYLNYGALGNIIGHEIIHGFDNTGRTIDKNGNPENWWQSDTREKYIQKAQCIVDQYNNFTVEEVDLHVNGITTQGENIADNGGFKVAYHAYNEWATRNNIVESCLPKMDYTQRQLFWISAASVWCSKHRPQSLRNLINRDPHSPGNARVIISLSNIKEFAEDFQCKPGTRMNPEKKCVLW